MNSYYQSMNTLSYCHPHTLNLGLDLVLRVFMLFTLESLKSFQSGGPAGNINRFYFAHSETFLPFLARLGLARDDPPLSLENIPEDRQWRTSFIGSESANLVVLGSRCGGQKVGLKLFLNERLVDHVIIPGLVPECEEQKYCELDKFVTHFQDMARSDISQVCRV